MILKHEEIGREATPTTGPEARSRGQGSYHLGFSVLVTCRPVTSDKAAMQGSEAKSEPEAKGIKEGAINSVGPEVR